MRSPGKLIERAVRNAAPPVRMSRGINALGMSSLRATGTGANDPGHQIDLWRQVAPLNVATTLLAQSVAMVRWHLYRTHDNRGRISGPDSRVEVFQHQALKVWNQPNEIMTGSFFQEIMQLQVELTAHTFWVVNKAGNIPTEMWPVSKKNMEVVPSKDPNSPYALAGFVYRGPDGELVPLGRDEVVWVRSPDPDDVYGGATVLQSMAVELESHSLTAQYKRNFFKNSAEPGGVLELGLQPNEQLSDADFNTLTTRWKEQHEGVRGAHRVAFLERGKWVPVSPSLKDLQFTELRRDDRDAVYEALGVSKSLLGVTEDVNRSNAETNEYVFSKYRTVPRCERVRDALNGPYLSMFGNTSVGVNFDYDNPVPEDWRAEAEALRYKGYAVGQLVHFGGATLESAAEAVGLTMLKPAPIPETPPALPVDMSHADSLGSM